MFEALDHDAKLERIKRLRSLRLPFLANQILEKGLDYLNTLFVRRAWSLPKTRFPDEIQHYAIRQKALGLQGPRPKLRQTLDKKIAEELAIKIDAAINFLDLAQSADPLIKPILLYYSCAHLCGVYTRAFFEWEQDHRHHGLNCAHKLGLVGDTSVQVTQKGQFPRIVITNFLLSGMPNCFSELITYSSSPTAHTGPGELLEHFGKTELGKPITSIHYMKLSTSIMAHNSKHLEPDMGFINLKAFLELLLL